MKNKNNYIEKIFTILEQTMLVNGRKINSPIKWKKETERKWKSMYWGCVNI